MQSILIIIALVILVFIAAWRGEKYRKRSLRLGQLLSRLMEKASKSEKNAKLFAIFFIIPMLGFSQGWPDTNKVIQMPTQYVIIQDASLDTTRTMVAHRVEVIGKTSIQQMIEEFTRWGDSSYHIYNSYVQKADRCRALANESINEEDKRRYLAEEEAFQKEAIYYASISATLESVVIWIKQYELNTNKQ